MIGENTTTVWKYNRSTEDFLRCSKNALKCVLGGGNINCDESKVFHACMAWTKFNCKENERDESSVTNLKQQLGEC